MVRKKSPLTPLRRRLRFIQRKAKKKAPIISLEARFIKAFVNVKQSQEELDRVAPDPLLEKPEQLRGRRVRPFIGGVFPGIFTSVVRIRRK